MSDWQARGLFAAQAEGEKYDPSSELGGLLEGIGWKSSSPWGALGVVLPA